MNNREKKILVIDENDGLKEGQHALSGVFVCRPKGKSSGSLKVRC